MVQRNHAAVKLDQSTVVIYASAFSRSEQRTNQNARRTEFIIQSTIAHLPLGVVIIRVGRRCRFTSFVVQYPERTVTTKSLKGVARGGGPEVPVTPPFVSLFLTKQPTTGGENAMTISWP